MPDSRVRRSFYLWIAVAISCTAFLGFSFTYFGPLFRGQYPEVSATVHLHGWSFFLWFLLFPLQAGLIRLRQVKLHRTLGRASVVLATIMVGSGLVVAAVQIDRALPTDGSPFWDFMGLPILSLLVLFTAFYAVAIRRRRIPADHKRLMLLASTAALGAATFRILGRAFGFEQWVWIVGFYLPVLFVVAAIVYDYWCGETLHRVYRRGFATWAGLTGAMFVAAATPGGDVLKRGLGWVGRFVAPLY